jgi:hypothetical protein
VREKGASKLASDNQEVPPKKRSLKKSPARPSNGAERERQANVKLREATRQVKFQDHRGQ